MPLREPTLSDFLDDARAGDVLAARQVLPILAELVGRGSTIPDCARKYLSQALAQVATGNDANRALHLVKRGPRIWSFEDKRLAIDVVRQLVTQGMTVEEACGVASDLIIANAQQSSSSHSPWRRFSRRGLDSATLHDWYYASRRQEIAL